MTEQVVVHSHLGWWTGDIIAAGTIVAAGLGYLPLIAAAVGLVFYGIQIWESKTVQAHVARCMLAKRSRHIVRLNKRVERAHFALQSAQKRLEQFNHNGEESASTTHE